jgi:hypothetical protein
MYDLHHIYKKENTSLSYLGLFSDELTNLLMNLAESIIADKYQLGKLKKRISFLIAETFQNVIRHGVYEKENAPEIVPYKDFFQINIQDDRVNISTANIIEQKYVPGLNDGIDRLNALDSAELKQMYKDILDHGKRSERGGANLGLIEIVRKSGLPLDKHFIPLTQDYAQVFLSLEIAAEKDQKTHKTKMQDIVKQYRSLIEKDIIMLYKGDFSAESITNLVEMLHNNFVDETRVVSDNIRNIISIIELMQNVSKHGKAINGLKEGIFSISDKNGKVYIDCANFVGAHEYKNLNDILHKIKSSTLDEIEHIYKEKLSNTEISEQGDSGMGLLEIARFTQNHFTYGFRETSANEYFYSININTEQ